MALSQKLIVTKKSIILCLALVLNIGLAGCAILDLPQRDTPFRANSVEAFGQATIRDYAVHSMTFIAPTNLKVSESNGYYPMGDIVWRGDPVGNRIEQVANIFETAVQRNQSELSGRIPIVVDIELVRFHGVTERTRFSMGGVYNIVFDLTLRHAKTGAVVERRHRVKADLTAPGGYAALLQEQRGETEKVRVTDYLTQIMRGELTGNYQI